MKKTLAIIVVLAITPVVLFAYANPGKPTGFVNDFANIINPQDRQTIETRLQSLKDSNGAEVAVVTVDSLGGDTVENFAVELFREWGIGDEKKDNGLLVLVAPNEREVRIEVGYGLEGDITDLESGIIIRNVMIPAFRNNDYSRGISEAVDAISAIIMRTPNATRYLDNVDSSNLLDKSSDQGINFFLPMFFVIIIFNIAMRFFSKTKSWWLGGVLGVVVGTIIGIISWSLYIGILSVIILSILGLISDYFASKRPPGSNGRSGSWFWGGHGGHGMGGGFGGFGGGLSGGGGASGRW